MKTSTKILLTVVIALSLLSFTLVDAFFVSPKKYDVRNETLQDESIGEQLNDMNILFFSDLDYGTFMNEERLNKLIDKINGIGADVIIFGGDIYDYDAEASEESNTIIANAFSQLEAKYGKFAVYGDVDDRSEDMKNAVNSIYSASSFEVIENASFPIHKNGSQFITIVGLDNGVNGTKDIESAFANVSADGYVITVCHTPDTATEVPSDLTDYFLAGHSHGGQIYYFFSASYTPSYATKYLRGKHTVSNAFTLDITNGVGTRKNDVRLFADAEVVLYTLKHEETKQTKNTQTQATTETTSE